MSLSCILNWWMLSRQTTAAEIAQLGERVTEDHKVPGSIPGFGTEHPAASHFLVLKGCQICYTRSKLCQALRRHSIFPAHSLRYAYHELFKDGKLILGQGIRRKNLTTSLLVRTKISVKQSPNVGLEPTTLRLRV